MSINFGTPLFAWQVGNRARSLGPVGLVVVSVVAMVPLMMLLREVNLRTGPLWAALGVWWALAVLTISRSQAEEAFWWLRNILVFRLIVMFLECWRK